MSGLGLHDQDDFAAMALSSAVLLRYSADKMFRSTATTQQTLDGSEPAFRAKCVSPRWSAEQLAEPLLRGSVAEGRVPPDAVIDRQVLRQPGFSLLGVFERHHISPFLAEGLDESLRFLVGSWLVAPPADVAHPEHAASFGERLGNVRRPAVACTYRAALDPLAVESDDSTAEKADHCWFLSVCEHLGVGQPRGVIVSDKVLVVAKTSGMALLLIDGDAVAHPPEPGQRLDFELDKIA